jgi:hypothetical protein
VSTLYLVEFEAFNPATQAVETLRYATGRGHTTGPAETPANTHYDARVQQPAVMRRDMFGAGITGGPSRVGFGDLVLLNGDGALDTLKNYGVGRRSMTIRRGTPGAAYPSGFPVMLVATMEGMEVGRETVTIRLRDRQLETQVPLQETKYRGTNQLPHGVEGVADDLKGKPKPVCLGAVTNISPPCVNTSKLIYQVHDGPVFQLSAVYDRGVALRGRAWATMALVSAATILRWACEGEDGTLLIAGGYNTPIMNHSTDGGATWTATTMTGFPLFPYQYPGTSFVQGVAYGAGRYVGLCMYQYIFSTDTPGNAWTRATLGLGSSYAPGGVVWAGDRFLAWWNSSTGPVELRTSTDGLSWSSPTLTGFTDGTDTCYHITYGAGVYVAVGAAGAMSYSEDGTTWVDLPAVGTEDLYRIAYANGVFVAVGASGTLIRSTDGVTWESAANAPAGTTDLHAVGYGFGHWIAGGGWGNDLIESVDTVNWYPLTTMFGANALNYIFWSETYSQFLLVGDGGKAFMDNGGIEEYATYADLMDEAQAPWPGSVKAYSSGGYFRLGTVPDGEVTADVVGASTANMTAGQLYTTVLGRAGLESADWSAADITALDSANAAVLGYWSDAEENCDAVLSQIAGSVGAWWGVDQDGVFRIQRLEEPTGTPEVSFTAADMLQPLTRITPSDPGHGRPAWRSVLRWGRVWSPQTDLAGSVTDAHRNTVSREWREVLAEDAAVRIQYLLAPQLTDDSLLTTEADALAEVQRRQGIRGWLHDVFTLTVPLDDETAALDLGSVVRITHARYGLSLGRLFRVMSIEPDATRGRLGLTVWGTAYDGGRIPIAPTLAGTGSALLAINGSGAMTVTSVVSGVEDSDRTGTGDVVPAPVIAGGGWANIEPPY